MLRPTPRSTLFPYTTLFRSDGGNSPNHPSTTIAAVIGTTSATVIQSSPSMKLTRFTNQRPASKSRPRSIQSGAAGAILRSEEHTSELQSHSDLVCRLLLEKK